MCALSGESRLTKSDAVDAQTTPPISNSPPFFPAILECKTFALKLETKMAKDFKMNFLMTLKPIRYSYNLSQELATAADRPDSQGHSIKL